MDEIRKETRDIPGILVEVTSPRAGPPTGKPVQVQLSAIDPDKLPAAAKKVAGILSPMPAIRDLDDGLPLPGIDWRMEVDKAEAAKYGANISAVGTAVQLVTNGVKVTEYRPSDSDKAVDIIVRFPRDRRSLDQLDELRVQTPSGYVPIGNFVQRVPAHRVGYISRVNAHRVITVAANIADGVQNAVVQKEITDKLNATDLGDGVTFKLKGEDEEREKAGAFLSKAFGTALFLIFAILLAQFNRFTSVVLVLTAVLLSTIGVLLGLMIMGQPFGVVMTGIGIIANAGVIVNNNIVLIDTYDRLRREGQGAYEAILETCRERMRPVLLTAVTAILGVLPIAFGINLDFIDRAITHGAPATQWWISLSTAIVFGLGFATVLTLILTPAALMGIANVAAKREHWRERWRERWQGRRAATRAAKAGT
jgi:multidrug efflux pump